MTHQYKKLPVTMKMWMQFNVIPRTQIKERAHLLKSTVKKHTFDHEHEDIDCAHGGLREALSFLQQTRNGSRWHAAVWCLAVREEFPQHHTCNHGDASHSISNHTGEQHRHSASSANSSVKQLQLITLIHQRYIRNSYVEHRDISTIVVKYKWHELKTKFALLLRTPRLFNNTCSPKNQSAVVRGC